MLKSNCIRSISEAYIWAEIDFFTCTFAIACINCGIVAVIRHYVLHHSADTKFLVLWYHGSIQEHSFEHGP